MKKVFTLLVGVILFSSCQIETISLKEALAIKSSKAKVNVCHKGKIINVSSPAVMAHLAHGDAVDIDGDGFFNIENPCSAIDCDDTNADINPYAEEVNDGLDNNCDGNIDENDCVVINPLTNSNIHDAVQLWYEDQEAAELMYGHISNWCTSNITDMSKLFALSTVYDQYTNFFNEDISNWDVSNVTNMSGMFLKSNFNSSISDWDVSNVTDMSVMFYESGFNQPIGDWDVSNVTDMSLLFGEISSFSVENYDNLLLGWSARTLKPNVTIDVISTSYCLGETARDYIINTYGWTINDAGKDCSF